MKSTEGFPRMFWGSSRKIDLDPGLSKSHDSPAKKAMWCITTATFFTRKRIMAKRNYNRCVKIIVLANEHIVDDRSDLADELLDELGELRPTLTEEESAVVGRLVQSIFVSDGRDIEIDEATGGSLDYDQ